MPDGVTAGIHLFAVNVPVDVQRAAAVQLADGEAVFGHVDGGNATIQRQLYRYPAGQPVLTFQFDVIGIVRVEAACPQIAVEQAIIAGPICRIIHGDGLRRRPASCAGSLIGVPDVQRVRRLSDGTAVPFHAAVQRGLGVHPILPDDLQALKSRLLVSDMARAGGLGDAVAAGIVGRDLDEAAGYPRERADQGLSSGRRRHGDFLVPGLQLITGDAGPVAGGRQLGRRHLDADIGVAVYHRRAGPRPGGAADQLRRGVVGVVKGEAAAGIGGQGGAAVGQQQRQGAGGGGGPDGGAPPLRFAGQNEGLAQRAGAGPVKGQGAYRK
ncbi:MAG: hypothetical protein DBY38_11365 [Clostridium cadaveris]|uniref:Uncharacterized protein n=1 Tax=Clostridium cadaveris TaxID=1529 RepID=A0A316M175_9CLOT|nr:MAG: hypothetical protein DBY38_11365 [Clostridium cadaveris]